MVSGTRALLNKVVVKVAHPVPDSPIKAGINDPASDHVPSVL